MAINFPNSPSNGATATLAGKTYTYDSSKSKWSPSGGITLSSLSVGAEGTASGDGAIAYNGAGVFSFTPAVAAGTGVTVHASQSAMIAADASSAVSEGSLHYDTGANKLYVKMGDASSTGFYLLASITNASPTISSPSTGTSFTLDGSPNPTTISIAASDSDTGQVLNYYYTVSTGSIGSGTTVTTSATSGGTYASSGNAVAGSSNASTNSHFRINPSNSVATNFSLTFYVTDGTNISNTICSFTLAFIIANSRYTSLLMSANAAGTNSTFTDSSSSGHTITPSGNPTQGSFSPYRKGGYSVEFGGSSPKLSHGGSRSTISGSSDYSFSLWIYPQSGVDKWIYENATPFPSSVNSTGSQDMYLAGGSQITFRHHNGSSLQTITGPAVTLNTWTYILINRTSSTTTMYVNGSSAGSSSAMNGTIVFQTNAPYIGSNSGGDSFDGFITDFHFRTAAASSPTNVPTQRVASDSSTLILSCHLPYPVDGSSNNFSVTLSGDASISPYGPFDYGEAGVTDGGSIEFDGDDMVTIPANTDFHSSEYTVECWVRPNVLSGYQCVIDNMVNASGSRNFSVQMSSTGAPFLYARDAYITNLNMGTTKFKVGEWTHVAVVVSTSVEFYMDGVLTGSATGVSGGTNTQVLTIGRPAYTGSRYLNGSVSDVRLTAKKVYTGAFTPPTEPLETTQSAGTNIAAISGTECKLLVSGQGAKVFDKSQTQNFELSGAQGNATNKGGNWAGTFSTRLASTSDYVKFFDKPITGTMDFTIEAFLKWDSTTGFNTALYSRYYLNTNRGVLLYGNTIYLASASNTSSWGPSLNLGTPPSAGTWYHLAAVRHGANLYGFINGTRTASSNIGATFDVNDPDHATAFADNFGRIGAGRVLATTPLGYISDFRITHGFARYTAADETGNIPTAPLKG